MVRAALYTAGVVGGLTLTAACAPSERYLTMSGPLSLGLGVVLVASIGRHIEFVHCFTIVALYKTHYRW